MEPSLPSGNGQSETVIGGRLVPYVIMTHLFSYRTLLRKLRPITDTEPPRQSLV